LIHILVVDLFSTPLCGLIQEKMNPAFSQTAFESAFTAQF